MYEMNRDGRGRAVLPSQQVGEWIGIDLFAPKMDIVRDFLRLTTAKSERVGAKEINMER